MGTNIQQKSDMRNMQRCILPPPSGENQVTKLTTPAGRGEYVTKARNFSCMFTCFASQMRVETFEPVRSDASRIFT